MDAIDRGWVIVAGASGSLGQGCVAYYAQSGPVLALDRAAGTDSSTTNISSAAVDLTVPEQVDAALDMIPRDQTIALLVNAVGMIWNEPVVGIKGAKLKAHDVARFRDVIDANLTASFVVSSRVAARMMRKGGGAIVNFSSLSATGIAGQAAYSAAKAGVSGMTKAMATELGAFGIRVNAVAPGFIDVPSTRAALTDAKIADYVSRTPSGRLGLTSELIAAVDFLATNKFVNGTVLEVNGGLKL